MSPTVVMREASFWDASALVRLRRSIRSEGAFFYREPDEPGLGWWRTVREIDALARSTQGLCVVLQLDEQLAGYLILRSGIHRRTRHVAWLEMGLDATARGKGHGRRLLEAGMTWMEAHPQLAQVHLSVLGSNDAALALYRSAGFVEVGRMPDGVVFKDNQRTDEVLMMRQVKEIPPRLR